MNARLKPAYILSLIIAAMALLASAGGLFIDGIYRDNAFVTAAWRGNDLVTLVVALPLLVGSLLRSRAGSERAQVVWVAILGYMAYNYIFYLYGAAFNSFFLLYVALFSMSVFALIVALSRLDVAAIAGRFGARTPVRLIGGFMLFFAIPWGAMEVTRALSFLFTGEVPADIIMTGHPTGVVYATDLALLVPSMVLGAILLWKRRVWGYMLAAMLMIKGTTYALALVAMSAFAAGFSLSGRWDPFTPVYIGLVVGCLASTWALLGNMRGGREAAPSSETGKIGAAHR